MGETFTPGPWEVEGPYGPEDDREWQVDADHVFIASVYSSAANARLIASAPHLYAALDDTLRILKAVRYTVGLGKRQLARIEAAEAALAKASPESEGRP